MRRTTKLIRVLGAAAGIALTPAISAHGEEAEHPIALEDIQVPLEDARGVGVDGVQATAAYLSDDAQVIVLYGPTKETFREVIQAARRVLYDKSTALKGVIVASPTGNGYGTEIAFYVDGQLSATILGAEKGDHGDTSNLNSDIEIILLKDYKEVIVPRRLKEAERRN